MLQMLEPIREVRHPPMYPVALQLVVYEGEKVRQHLFLDLVISRLNVFLADFHQIGNRVNREAGGLPRRKMHHGD
jgi:hypothetical protein